MRNAWLIPLMLSVVIAPAASGFHFSVGSQDAVGVQASETRTAPDVGGDLFERGLGQGCSDDARVGPSQAGPEADPFCGRLVYHENSQLEQIAEPDQDIRVDGWSFDVVVTQYVGTYELDTCYPWCAPGGEPVYRDLDETLHQTAPEVFSGTDDEDAGSPHHSYAIDLRVPNAVQVAQSETGTAEGSGWLMPNTDPQFVGFLTDGSGAPVTPTGLAQQVGALKSTGALPSSAAPAVCGYSPDVQTEGPTKDAPLTASVASACDVLFTYKEEGQDTDFGPDSDDRCSSATYVCGTITPAWYGQLACKGWVGCQAAHEAGDSWHSTGDYDVWHFVVAPSPSECSGQQQPGFAFETGTDKPYLAHDLDVYTPATAFASDVAPGQPADEASETYVAPVERQADAGGKIDPVETREQLADVAPLPEPAKNAYRTAVKKEIPEPNAEGDTSQSLSVDRTLGDCDRLGSNAETDATADPWVNIVDTTQRWQTWNGADLTQAAPYLNTADQQDENNRPGPGWYLSDGKVGFFADKDDDGVYDQASAEQLFTGIQEVGAYPMFYDMHLDGDLNPSGGCQAEFAQKPIAEAMADAGYGPRTGLVEAIYLKEPTAILDRLTGEVYPYPSGNNVFVAKTQAIKALEAAGDPLVGDLIEDVIDDTGAPADATVVPLHEVKSQPSDFWEQCGEGTGRYVQQLMFYHSCQVDCSGDTIVTKYLFEVDDADGVLGGSTIPAFQPDGQTYTFEPGTHVWTDVDPFDNDPDRTTRDGTPPH